MDFNKEYEIRKANSIDELRKIYLDTYEDRFDAFTFLIKNMDNAFSYRKEAMKALDSERANNPSWFHKNNSYGMTIHVDDNENNLEKLNEHIEYLKDFDISFVNVLPVLKQSVVANKPGALPDFISVDLKYGNVAQLAQFCASCKELGISVCYDNIGEYCKPENMDKILENPILFNKMVYDILMFANLGVDIFKINCRPYKWNDLGVDFSYTDQKFHVVRMIRMILDMVCPGCLLLCNGEYDNGSTFSYFTFTNQECQLVNNISNKDILLDTIENKNVLKLRNMIDSLAMMGRNSMFLNYIQDPWQEDWQNLAALCGIHKAQDRIEMEMATDFDMMLQGYLMMIPGVPFMHLGDELGQVEGKSVDWTKAKLRFNTDSHQYKIYNNLMHLKRIRAVYDVFSKDARCFTYDTFDPSVLGVVRTMGEKKIIGLFNFSSVQKTAWIIDPGPYTDIISNDYIRDQSIHIKPYGMMWLYNQRPEVLEDY